MILQTRCAGCDRIGPALCTTCRFALVGPRPRVGGHGVVAAVAFTGRARRVVLGLKYRNRRLVARHLAGLIVNALVERREHAGIDLVTWAPTSAHRRRRRGYDQAELLASAVARQLGVPCRRLLERDGADGSQTGRSRVERLDAVRFRAHPRVAGRTVLVVDDVVTTGATLGAAADALHGAGARRVGLYAAAATPLGVTGSRRTVRRTDRRDLDHVGPDAPRSPLAA